MPTLNIKDIPESKVVKLVDLSEDSINKIVEAVARKIAVNGAEVIRCKDCKFYTEEEHWCRRLGLCGAFNKNDFCSHGEKEDGIN